MKNLLFLFFVLLLSVNVTYSQVIIHVPGDYPTIQEAINAAILENTIILVAEGIYYENIDFKGKAITVASQFLFDGDTTHISNTIINGSQPLNPDSGSVVRFLNNEDTTSVLCGFTIIGGTGVVYAGSSFRVGGGIFIRTASPLIKNNIIEYNNIISHLSTRGSAIFIELAYNKTLIIKNNIIRNNLTHNLNSTTDGCGAVFIWYYTEGDVILRSNVVCNNILIGNANLFGGGITVLGNNSPHVCIIESNKIVNNEINDTPGSIFQWGGGIYIQDINAIVRNNIIAYNSAEDGGGIYYYNNQPTPSLFPVIENNTIYGNKIAQWGYAGAMNTDIIYSVMNCVIWGNSSPQFYGTLASITYSDIEETYTNGSNNISENPQFLDTSYFCLSNTSPCIDQGNPDPMCNDVEDPFNLGHAMWPAQGGLRNDMGHCGGPNSCWCSWEWPVQVELTSFTATSQLGKVILNWTTATEINNLGFEIERTSFPTTPGQEKLWITIGFVTGKGTTSEPQEYSYIDDISDINATSLVYRLKQMDFDGSFEYLPEVEVEVYPPLEFSLEQNYPNPFNPITRIKYSIPSKSLVSLIIYNPVGEEIINLVNEIKEMGNYEEIWSAGSLASGVYYYQLKADGYVETKKMLLIK